VVSDVTSLEHFRRHQELNSVPYNLIIPRQIFSPFFTVAVYMPMPTAPIQVFHASAQNVFAFPYAPASSFQKEPPKWKWKNHET
jgi:hypothetical protein